MCKKVNLTRAVTAKYSFKGKTKFNFWNSVKEGDCLYLSLELKPVGRNNHSMYAPKVSVHNTRTGEERTETFNLVQQYLTKVGVYDE